MNHPVTSVPAGTSDPDPHHSNLTLLHLNKHSLHDVASAIVSFTSRHSYLNTSVTARRSLSARRRGKKASLVGTTLCCPRGGLHLISGRSHTPELHIGWHPCRAARLQCDATPLPRSDTSTGSDHTPPAATQLGVWKASAKKWRNGDALN